MGKFEQLEKEWLTAPDDFRRFNPLESFEYIELEQDYNDLANENAQLIDEVEALKRSNFEKSEAIKRMQLTINAMHDSYIHLYHKFEKLKKKKNEQTKKRAIKLL